ncbi:ATP-binding domain-containing protein, partial [Christensenellaceae bacterium OttesenSCG-928-M15]|nr:ATP-binding domain-containing protein [Christensenellaceae bacterium OttesenSCG-928-M15]
LPHRQTRYEMLEMCLISDGATAAVMKSSLAFKCAGAFKQMLDRMENPGKNVKEIFASYERLFSDRKYFDKMAQGIALPPDIDAILQFTNENLHAPTLFFDDASALAYLVLRQCGNDAFRHIRHVVVDEVQDYYPLHFEIIKLLFPNAKYTLLGDVAQTIEKRETMDFYEEALNIFHKRKSAVVRLEKSFRCTNEIIRFSADIMGMQISAFGREGEKPVVCRLESEGDTEPLIQEIEAAKAKGYGSIGIVCKSNQECRRLYEALGQNGDIHILEDTADAKLSGAFLLPVYLSKGLEFDAVCIWGADDAHYHTKEDQSLLFIACTRALHRLRIFYHGEPSAYLARE